jgi:hypothetical protein
VLKEKILDHYVERFGPFDDSGHRFSPGAVCSAEVYRFPPSGTRDVYTYACVHAHAGMAAIEGHAAEFFAVSREEHDVLLDLVAVCATRGCGDGEPMDEWSVLKLAREIPGTRGMTWLLTAPPVFEGEDFAHLAADDSHLRFLWAIPIFESEALLRRDSGAPALEAVVFAKTVDLADLDRAPVV